MRRGKRRRGGNGCGYLVFVCLTACVLLVVNAIVIRAMYEGLPPETPPVVKDPRFGRAVLFVGPILLLVVEWTLIDRLKDLFAKSPDLKKN